jgi:hypothetical protein
VPLEGETNMKRSKPKRDPALIREILAEYQRLRDRAADAQELLDVGSAAQLLVETHADQLPAHLPAVMLLGSVLVEYAILETTLQLEAAGASDADHDAFVLEYEKLNDAAHAAAWLLRERLRHTDVDAVAVAKTPNTVVLVDDAGVEVAGFQIDTCNAPGSSEAN